MTARSAWLRERMGLSTFSRVTDRRTFVRLAAMAALTTVVSLLEVIALLCVAPLIQLLSGQVVTGPAADVLTRVAGGLTPTGQAIVVLVLVVVLMVVRAALSVAIRWSTIGAISAGAATATSDLLATYLDAPLPFHEQQHSARLLHTASYSIPTIFNQGLVGLTIMVSDLILVVLVCAMLVLVSPLAALAATVYFTVVALVFMRVAHRRTAAWAARAEIVRGSWLTTFGQALAGIREIRLRGVEREFTAGFGEVRAEQAPLDRRIIFSGEVGRYLLESAFMIGFGVLGVVVLLTQGADSASVLAVLLFAGFRLMPSVARILGAQHNVRVGRAAAETVATQLDALGRRHLGDAARTAPPPVVTADPPGPAVGVELLDVGFRYGPGVWAVRGLTGRVDGGGSLGIVGATGSGKSTTVDLICGLIEPTEGSVRVGGHPTTSADRSWQRRIAYVPQDVFLLDASIRDNIVFTRQPIREESLWRAVRLAQLEEWLAQLPDGFDTTVGERGVRLSGGQRQRIGLARALYRDPSLLILDEATSALDVETEAAISEAIEALSGSITLIVVAHRLSTVRRCEQLLLLDHGVPTAWGGFDELAASDDRFRRWVRLAGMA